MADSTPERTLSEDELENIRSTSSSLSGNKSLILIVQEQVLEKEKAVREQQIALDLKDERLRDCQANLAEYDKKIMNLEAKLRYLLGFKF